MKHNLNKCLLALTVAVVPGFAAAGDYVHFDDLAAMSGLTERNVQMLLGNRSSFPEYRYAWIRVERQFVEAVGVDRYRDLLAGKPVRFERIVDGERVAFVVQLQPES